MFPIQTQDDFKLIRETATLECKLARGRDGRGALPDDFWPTYSAFANTGGGIVLLGVREKNEQFELVGIENVEKIRTDLFNGLNNRQKVSTNLLKDDSVQEINIDGRVIIAIEIPRANRKQRPVHLTQNPLSGHTYKRFNDGDHPLSDEDVKRMLAEQVEDSRDDKILFGYNIDDLNLETLRAFRQVFANREPAHPWNAIGDQEFLRQIGGWKQDRESRDSGVTLAGLLMFGEMVAIQEALPYYMLDYQERPEAKTENRWVDRLTLDGKWSGNLYDFYRRVYLKLTSDLKVPFRLEKDERQDETPVHIALREALANVLAHADYTDRASILVVKRPDMFGFRNPGLMRIPVEVALHGGEADCRNRTLHKMFRLVGVGEQAGTGIPKIFQGWNSQHWNPPKLYELSSPYNQTLLELRMIDLFPSEIMEDLRSKFGAKFDTLNYDERVALALAASEGTVNHSRLCTVSTGHPVELSRTLQHLITLEMLESTGGRRAVYKLPWQDMPTPDDVFGPTFKGTAQSGISGSDHSNLGSRSSDLNTSSSGLTRSSPDLRKSQRSIEGYLITDQLPLPVIDALEPLSNELRERLEAIAEQPRAKKKVDRAVLESVLIQICDGHYLSLQCIAALVNRRPESLRNEYLSRMVRDRTISLAFPTTPTHERQAYCSSRSIVSDISNNE